MAFKIGGDETATEEVHEINVTPFIDVILVLLIIFMVAAPLSTVDIPVQLPAASTAPSPRPDKPIFVTLAADQTLSVGDIPVTMATLASELRRATAGDAAQVIYLRADKALAYGLVIALLNEMRTTGFTKVALVMLDKPSAP